MKRRDFIKSTVGIAALTGINTIQATAAPAGRDYYELRAYRLKDASKMQPLMSYLEKAAIPALNRLGIQPVGVFTEIEPQPKPSVFVLLPSPSIETLSGHTLKLNNDSEYLKAGTDYLNVTKSDPAFERIDSWFFLAFAGMPKLEQPAYSKERKARIFELRTYESHSELKAQNKVDMFNAGEIDVPPTTNTGMDFENTQPGRSFPATLNTQITFPKLPNGCCNLLTARKFNLPLFWQRLNSSLPEWL
jgi:hypothetical protein